MHFVSRRAILNCFSAVLVVLVHLCLGMTDIYPIAPLVLLGLWYVSRWYCVRIHIVFAVVSMLLAFVRALSYTNEYLRHCDQLRLDFALCVVCVTQLLGVCSCTVAIHRPGDDEGELCYSVRCSNGSAGVYLS